MVRLASKLLVLLAVLLMPLGMTPAGGAAQHHSTASAMPMQHCPDPAQTPGKGTFAQCTMACASALLAVGKSIGEAPVIVCARQVPTPAQLLNGLHPETATPPPKRS